MDGELEIGSRADAILLKSMGSNPGLRTFIAASLSFLSKRRLIYFTFKSLNTPTLNSSFLFALSFSTISSLYVIPPPSKIFTEA